MRGGFLTSDCYYALRGSNGSVHPMLPSDFLKTVFIAQAKSPAKKNCALKCAGKAIKHRKGALKSVKSG